MGNVFYPRSLTKSQSVSAIKFLAKVLDSMYVAMMPDDADDADDADELTYAISSDA